MFTIITVWSQPIIGDRLFNLDQITYKWACFPFFCLLFYTILLFECGSTTGQVDTVTTWFKNLMFYLQYLKLINNARCLL